MNKKYRIALIITFLLAIMFVADRDQIVRVAKAAFGLSIQNSNPDVSGGTVISATTLNYMTPGTGTSTITVYTGGADHMDVNVFGVASGTPMELRYTVEFSNSTSSVASERVWYVAPNNVLDATTTVQTPFEGIYRFSSSTVHRLATSTAMNTTFDQDTTFSMAFRIRDIVARWTRVVFYIPTMGILRTQTTALGPFMAATSTNGAIIIQPTTKEPL